MIVGCGNPRSARTVSTEKSFLIGSFRAVLRTSFRFGVINALSNMTSSWKSKTKWRHPEKSKKRNLITSWTKFIFWSTCVLCVGHESLYLLLLLLVVSVSKRPHVLFFGPSLCDCGISQQSLWNATGNRNAQPAPTNRVKTTNRTLHVRWTRHVRCGNLYGQNQGSLGNGQCYCHWWV